MTQLVASLSVNPNEREALDIYFRVAMRLLDQAGGKVVRHLEIGDPIIGDRISEIILIVEYPDADAIARVFESPDYQAIIPMRDRAFTKYNMCIVNDKGEADGANGQ